MVKKNKFILIVYAILFCICAIPTIWCIITQFDFLQFHATHIYGFHPLFSIVPKQSAQIIISTTAISALSIVYFYICRSSNCFSSIKELFIYGMIIACIVSVILPITSTDLYYYLGSSRLTNYGQNPYLITIKNFIEPDNFQLLLHDSVLKMGYSNMWNNEIVIYGGLFTTILSIINFISCGNMFIALYLYKLCTVIVHMINAMLVYKITNKKNILIFYLLNPFILFEYIVNGHNDIFLFLFLLLAVYFLQMNKLTPCVLCLACAASIKYVALLLLPFFVLYNTKNKNWKEIVRDCFKYGSLFALTFVLTYLPYLTNLSILFTSLSQTSVIYESIYHLLLCFLQESIVLQIRSILFVVFIAVYFLSFFLYARKMELREHLGAITSMILCLFIFLALTNFKVWYLIWILPVVLFTPKSELFFKSVTLIEIFFMLANRNVILFFAFYVFHFVILIFVKRIDKKYSDCNKPEKT